MPHAAAIIMMRHLCRFCSFRFLNGIIAPLQVEEWMSQASGVPLEKLRQYMFLYHDREATEHIMRVSGGLDSLVMGEGQILAQVSSSLTHTSLPDTLSLVGLHIRAPVQLHIGSGG